MSVARIKGIIPPVVTPFRQDGSIDLKLHRREVRYMADVAGVHGVTVCGSTGEGHTLSTSECHELLGAAKEEVKGKIPVIAGVIVNSTVAAIERARALRDLSPEALQVTPVHYLFRPDDDSMVRYFSEIVQASGLPIIVYNVVPWAYLSVPVLLRILHEVDGVIGVKQSASDVKAMADLLHLVLEAGMEDRVRIITAVDPLLYPSFQLGAHAAIAAILSAVPELCVALWNAVQTGNHECAQDLHGRILSVWNAIDAPNLPANVRVVMQMLGRDGGFPRSPMPVSSEDQTDRIRSALAAVQQQVAASSRF